MPASGMRVCVVSGFVSAVVASVAGAQVLSFAERSTETGLLGSHSYPPSLMLEFHVAGVSVADFNNDGWQDVFVVGGRNQPDQLFMNNGDGTFTDQAAAWGVDVAHRGAGAAAGDYNNDGFMDIMVTSQGNNISPVALPGQHKLYRNNGDGTFTNVALNAGVAITTDFGGIVDTTSPAFGDYDLDGDLDLAVAGWYGGNRLFRNNGDGTFTNVTTTAIDADMTEARSYVPMFADMNGDRYPEILWTSDFFTTVYLVNNGDGTFTDQTLAAGVGLDSNGMGNAVNDFNGDGLLDWYCTSRINAEGTSGSGNMLYFNNGDGTYDEVSVAAGVNPGFWSWGASSDDFDCDGHADIVVTNGWNGNFENKPTLLFMNNGDGTFTESSVAAGLIHTDQGRGIASVDFDNDGDRDILIAANNGPLAVFENELSGPGGNWLRIEFDTSDSDDLAPNGIGTRVEITIDGVTQVRYLSGGSNFLSHNELAVHFGLGDATSIDEIVVMWANGVDQVLVDVAANQRLVISPAEACIADQTEDGVVDFFDVQAFLAAFASQAPSADLTGDGTFDFFDVQEFLQAFAAGCP